MICGPWVEGNRIEHPWHQRVRFFDRDIKQSAALLPQYIQSSRSDREKQAVNRAITIPPANFPRIAGFGSGPHALKFSIVDQRRTSRLP
jgi:hypothetical protein